MDDNFAKRFIDAAHETARRYLTLANAGEGGPLVAAGYLATATAITEIAGIVGDIKEADEQAAGEARTDG